MFEHIITWVRHGAAFAILTAILGSVPLAAAQSQAGPPASLVRVDSVRIEPLAQTVPVIGRLVARQTGDVAARIAGPVAELRAQVGDRVAAGDTIALLDPTMLTARRELAESAVAEAAADLTTAEAEVKLAGQEVARLEGLRKSVAFPQGRFDDARQSVTVAKAKVAKARATIAARKASLDLADISLRYSRIVAPYPGVITRRMTEVGAYVNAGDAVARLIGDTALEAEADVPSARLSALVPGAEVAITLDDGRRVTATVRATLPRENPLTRTRIVRFVPAFGGETSGLADAQSVTIHVPVGVKREVLTVHKDAIIKKSQGDTVFVVAEGKAVPRTIRLGEASGGRMVVLAGLKDGDKVVVRGNERLLPGAAVRIDSGT